MAQPKYELCYFNPTTKAAIIEYQIGLLGNPASGIFPDGGPAELGMNCTAKWRPGSLQGSLCCAGLWW